MLRYILLLLMVLTQSSSFAVLKLNNGVITSMESDSDKIISYKHQEHMWITSDGAIHMMIKYNVGMSLFTSFNQGQTWDKMISTEGVEQPASSDGVWDGDYLYSVFSTKKGNIGVAKLFYNQAEKSWSEISRNAIEVELDVTATRPTISIDKTGILWVAFPANHIVKQKKYIRIYYSSDDAENWTDSGMRLGTDNNKSKAARIIALSDRTGIIYSDNDGKDSVGIWAFRMNDMPLDTKWNEVEIGRHKFKFFQDPLGTHYNVVADKFDNIHVTTSEAGKMVYFRYDAQDQTWSSPAVVDRIKKTAYTQLSITPDGRLFIIHNSSADVFILVSEDQGKTFEDYAELNPPATKDISFLFARVETPSESDGKTLHVLLQAKKKGFFGKKVLLHYSVPTDINN